MEERLSKYLKCLGVGEEDSRGQRERASPGNERSENHTDWIGTCVAIVSVWPKIVVGGALGKKPLLTCGGHAAGGHPRLTDLCP